ncbi:hypothetical protein D1BOALGB6SA_6945 [Olavius sp. associated proteobacterium Delta 1]|nr:hypothetical protein D1BOALGB6SA_6945 [Olavius sp. associated proteobacterium Delta 1]
MIHSLAEESYYRRDNKKHPSSNSNQEHYQDPFEKEIMHFRIDCYCGSANQQEQDTASYK